MSRLVSPAQRRFFDKAFDRVVESAPDLVREAMETVPIVVEDVPSREIMAAEGIHSPFELLGYYVGVPLSERSVEQPRREPDMIQIYRAGLLQLARRRGRIDAAELERQIRITLLHEVGHYYGLDEDDLAERGYG